MIIVVVLSLGLVFIGLTLTIIAHWPGYTAIGFNPLKIVGPVLLAVGEWGIMHSGILRIRQQQYITQRFLMTLNDIERMQAI